MVEPTAFVTGAATGIGRGLARKLDAMGWRVFAGIHRTPPDELMAGASERLRVVRMDVSEAGSVARAAIELRDALQGRGLDLLVNNAAMTGAPGPVECVNLDAFHALMEVNFWGPLRVCQQLLPLLRQAKRPRIVMVTSASVYLTVPIGCSYPTSKSALAALTRHLRMELAPFGIEVTALEPGGVATPMTSFRAEAEADCWASIPADLVAPYRSRFQFPGKPLESGFEYESPEHFADRVYTKIVCARRLRPVYVLGKGVGMLPWLHRLLPASGVERVWSRFFGVARGPRQ